MTPVMAEVRRALRIWRRARYEAPSRHFIHPDHARRLLMQAIAHARHAQKETA